MKHSRHKRIISGSLMLLVFVLFEGALLAAPNKAHAQLVVANPDLIAQNIQKQLSDQVFEKVNSALVSAIGSQLVNLILYSVNQVATESAIWVASGGQGNRPLISRDPADNFLNNVSASIVFEAYRNVDYNVLQANGGLIPGSNIRLPDDAAYLIGVREGLKSAYIRPEDLFDFTEIADNYQGYLVSVYESDATPQQKTEAILATMSHSFRSNEFSNGLQFYAETLLDAQMRAQVQTDQLIQNDGFLPQTEEGSNYISLPASFVAQDLFNSLQRPQTVAQDAGLALLGGSDNILLNIGQYAGVIFTNTLISELMSKFRGGFFDDVAPTFSDNPFDPNASDPFSRERAQDLFRSIQSFRPLEVQDYNLVSRLSSCPTSTLRNSRSLYSCAINTSLASAVSRAESGIPLTVQEAIDEGYLNGDWPLIPSSDVAANQDRDCRNYAFCHSNLIKMRKARLIPVGWEIAAELGSSRENPVTLNEAIAGFHDCNDNGERNNAHPLCHLIDPNWVLKAPESDCRTLAYGQLLTASGTDARAEECVDIQTCIDEGDDGTCQGGYGYCTREKNVWRFRGDICPEQYASCLTFETREGEQVNYLRNTVDFADCDADAVGCQWYATQQRPTADDTFDWPTINNVALADASDDAYKNRVYFNANVDECGADGAGCSEVLVRGNDLEEKLNIVQNPGFELDNNGDSWPDAWIAEDSSSFIYSTDNTIDRSGSSAIITGGDSVLQYGPIVNQSRFYAFSFYARQPDSATTGTATGDVHLFEEFGEESVDLFGLSFIGDGCSQVDTNGDGTLDTVRLSGTPGGTSYERFECVFTTPSLVNGAAHMDVTLEFVASSTVIDDVSLEQTSDPTSFHANYSTVDLTRRTVKIAPDHLGCTGAATDPPECGGYSQICSPNDVGCELYTPTNGDPAVSGVVSELDICPSVCSGYDTFKQEPTLYEPNGEFPLYFIPSTGDTCSEDAVGCSEFTNLATEEVEYYTFLRACVTEDQADSNTGGDQGAVFYTWEGSDEEGFQLREWRLLESDLDTAGYANYGYDTDGDGADDYFESDPGAAPCTNWSTDNDGINCTDDSNGDLVIDSATEACDAHEDILFNPDCREFYDTNGDIHYRNWTETVTVNNACVSYRKTDIAGLGDDTDSDGVDDGEENCLAAGGYFDTAASQCRFYGYSEESVSCAESENGCRNFTGGRSNNSRVAFEELFEGGTLSNWDTASASLVTLSNESIATDGHSIQSDGADIWTFLYDEGTTCTSATGCPSTTGSLGGDCTVVEGRQYCGTLANDIFAGKTYTLTFWAKGAGQLDVGFDLNFGGSPGIDVAFDENIEITSLWQRYSIGPIDLNARDFAGVGADTVLVFSNDSSVTYYIDNITLREGEENITLIKDSWVTPATCDVNLEGLPSPQYHLGCSEYTNTSGNVAYLKSFQRLCSEDKIGCSAYYRTFESDAPNAQILNATCTNPADSDGDGAPDAVTTRTDCHMINDGSGGFNVDSPVLCSISVNQSSCFFDLNFFIPETRLSDTLELSHIEYQAETAVIPADTDYYAIVRDQDVCSAGEAGCMELGEPTFSADKTVVESWSTVHLINDPDRYDEILCTSEELFCEAFDAGTEGVFFFKDPQNSRCEYKTNVGVGGTLYSGWFVEGTNEFCYGTGTCSDDGSTCSADADCRANTGICSATGDVCSSDLDCGQEEFCSGLSTATCSITSGSHIVGGNYSEIWRNGDVAYDGQVGVCVPEADTCTEFRDPLDYDDNDFYNPASGESYFFLNNGRLGEDGLLSSSRCNGQVSQEQGCVLFNDTGDSGRDYNSSATYVSSVHADDLYGGNPFDLVPPIDCNNGSSASVIVTPTGEAVDLCAQRCVYDAGHMNDISDGTSSWFKMLLDDIHDPNELFIYGESCVIDSDCAPKESETGVLVDGFCRTQVPTDTDTFLTELDVVNVNRLTNDTNKVLKVNRDRVCSEWLACSSSFTVWNPDLGQYQEVCDTIDLCTKNGEGANCVAWDTQDPAVTLDANRYASRDVSWYGEEYSGYSIPELYPIQHFEQVNVAPELVCGNSINGELSDTVCSEDADCLSALYPECLQNSPDFRLALNAGTCSEDHGESCVVGYCSDDGSACSADGQCASGLCQVGQCYIPSATACDSVSDCSAGQICSGGFCADDTGSACGVDFACSAGSCITNVAATRFGSCMRGSCLLALDGSLFDTEVHETAVCRAQPEQNSPFGNELVESWTYTDGSEVVTAVEDEDEIGTIFTPERDTRSGSVPFDTISGFENASLCAPGEECVCSYKKVAATTGQTAYVDSRTDIGRLGLCLGGEVDGAFCEEDDDCGPGIGGGSATCVPITREDTLVGLEGYCLERDTGLNIHGDPTLGACLTWLPVDQLAGSTDLFAKYAGAGVDDEVYYCGYATTYTDFYTSGSSEHGFTEGTSIDNIACAEVPGATGSCGSDSLGCVANAGCPNSYYAVMGDCNSGSDTENYADMCKPGSGDNDCPYVCVPYGATHVESGASCDPDGIEDGLSGSVTLKKAGNANWDFVSPRTSTTYSYRNEVYTVSGFGNFDSVADYSQKCAVTGIQTEDEEFYDLFYKDADENCVSGDNGGCANKKDSGNGFYDLYLSSFTYPACGVLIEASAGPGENVAFTDRVLGNGHTISSLNYTQTTPNEPFGEAASPREASFGLGPTATPSPDRIAVCYDETDSLEPLFAAIPYAVATTCDSYIHTSFSDPGALPYIDFTVRLGIPSYGNADEAVFDTSEGLGDLIGRYNEIFATINGLWVWDDLFNTSSDSVEGEYTEICSGNCNSRLGADLGSFGLTVGSYFTDNDSDVRETGTPPTVWAIDANNCYGTNCREGAEDALTVNNQNFGNLAGSGGFFRATMKFFAAADKDQLPIRRVIIDWGDDPDGGGYSGSDDEENYYKNHRGILPDSQSQSWCDTDTEWGMTDASCDGNFFNYGHTYFCSNTILNQLDACTDTDSDGVIDFSPCAGTNNEGVAACAFRPAVHVLDNWGWCTGVCTGITDVESSSGCFEQAADNLSNPADDRGECAYVEYPFGPGDTVDPWFYYNGTIYVQP